MSWVFDVVLCVFGVGWFVIVLLMVVVRLFVGGVNYVVVKVVSEVWVCVVVYGYVKVVCEVVELLCVVFVVFWVKVFDFEVLVVWVVMFWDVDVVDFNDWVFDFD